VFMGLTRGEAVLSVVVFCLVYAGVVLPRLGERLGVFLASRPGQQTTPTTQPPDPPKGVLRDDGNQND
jgi:hypothetical protein